MDSSISVLNVTGWDGSGNPPFFPAQIRPQGHDIIRTWAFYTILRSVALTGQKPWDEILVNGMVLGEDGFKMSKSRGNIIVPEEILVKYGADALRQWGAMGAATGSDIMFNWNDVVAASRFQTKMWNITKFALIQLEKEGFDPNAPVTALADRWLLVRLSDTVEAGQQRDGVLPVRCCPQGDPRVCMGCACRQLYRARQGPALPAGRIAGRARASCSTPRSMPSAGCSPRSPPTLPRNATRTSATARASTSSHGSHSPTMTMRHGREGNLLVQVVAEVRKYKHDNGLALNAPLGKVTIYAPHTVNDEGDTGRTLNADVHWRTDVAKLDRVITDIDFNRSVVGKTFRKEAQAFMDAVKALSPAQLENPPKTIMVNGVETAIPENAFTPKVSPTWKKAQRWMFSRLAM